MVWNGKEDVERVKKVIAKNAVNYTRYAFERKGGLFDQQPVRAAAGLVERKAGLDTEKYGGYNKVTASYFLLVKYTEAGKKPKNEMMFIPVDLMEAKRITDNKACVEYARKTIAQIIEKPVEAVQEISFPLGMRIFKINTLFSLMGLWHRLRAKPAQAKGSCSAP